MHTYIYIYCIEGCVFITGEGESQNKWMWLVLTFCINSTGLRVAKGKHLLSNIVLSSYRMNEFSPGPSSIPLIVGGLWAGFIRKSGCETRGRGQVHTKHQLNRGRASILCRLIGSLPFLFMYLTFLLVSTMSDQQAADAANFTLQMRGDVAGVAAG